MGLWGRIQVNGALQRLGKQIAANPHLWAVAPDGRPHFDHWVEEHASDDELISAAAALTAFLFQIPERYLHRDWGQQLAAIIQGSIECVRRGMVSRGVASVDSASGSSDAEEVDRASALNQLDVLASALGVPTEVFHLSSPLEEVLDGWTKAKLAVLNWRIANFRRAEDMSHLHPALDMLARRLKPLLPGSAEEIEAEMEQALLDLYGDK